MINIKIDNMKSNEDKRRYAYVCGKYWQEKNKK